MWYLYVDDMPMKKIHNTYSALLVAFLLLVTGLTTSRAAATCNTVSHCCQGVQVSSCCQDGEMDHPLPDRISHQGSATDCPPDSACWHDDDRDPAVVTSFLQQEEQSNIPFPAWPHLAAVVKTNSRNVFSGLPPPAVLHPPLYIFHCAFLI